MACVSKGFPVIAVEKYDQRAEYYQNPHLKRTRSGANRTTFMLKVIQFEKSVIRHTFLL